MLYISSGGGFGGRKESGQLRFGCIDRPWKKPIPDRHYNRQASESKNSSYSGRAGPSKDEYGDSKRCEEHWTSRKRTQDDYGSRHDSRQNERKRSRERRDDTKRRKT